MNIRTTTLAAALCAFLASASPAAAQEDPIDPIEDWLFDFESSVLWNVRNNTAIDYVLLPQFVSLRAPHFLHWEAANGDIIVRHRFHAIGQAFAHGPEDYYFGLAAAPSLEYWNDARTDALTFAIGGGFGWLNSSGGTDGQGQDFTLNWFSQLMWRHQVTDDFTLSLGVTFQHMSNGGATDPNPGIDALGPTIGLSWRF